MTMINSMSHDGRGIATINGKKTFVTGALPGETVNYHILRKHSNYDEATLTEIITASPDRVTPECPHFAICGGCSLQHLNHVKQISFKINALQEILQHFGELKAKEWLPPIIGPAFGYRKRARLSVKYVAKKEKVLIGFHEKNGRYIADITCCKILDPKVGTKIEELSKLIRSLSVFQHIPQLEIAIGEGQAELIFRILQALTTQDIELLLTFGKEYGFTIYTQTGGAETIKPLEPTQTTINYYTLPEQDCRIFFEPTDFTQINPEVNRLMVNRALELLAPSNNDTILDLFCGLGNFTLPLARKCKEIIGIEGSNTMVKRATNNASKNAITNAQFFAMDLTKDFPATTWATRTYDKILLDPPRTGALEICQKIVRFKAKTILYVSCNPATFARDAKELINQGYQLVKVGIVDMFPHTSHMETMGVFA